MSKASGMIQTLILSDRIPCFLSVLKVKKNVDFIEVRVKLFWYLKNDGNVQMINQKSTKH